MEMAFDESIMIDFTVQAKEHLASFEDNILQIEKEAANPPEELINSVFRVAHSIKGGAGFLGLDKLKDLTHVMETLLSLVRSGDLTPEHEHIDALLQGADIIGTMLDDIHSSNTVDISEIHALLTELLEGRSAAADPAAPAEMAGRRKRPRSPQPRSRILQEALTWRVPCSIRPVTTVPRPVIENTSSIDIKNGFSVSRSGVGT